MEARGRAGRRTVVIGYDGSADALRAVDFAAHALDVDYAVVVNVWRDPAVGLATAPAAAPPPFASPHVEADLERAAREVAEEGARRARTAGLDAGAETRLGMGPRDISRVLHELAVDCGAELIVVGHGHASMLESALLGSVAVSAVRDERKPVLVVPA
jgi:nucleotide-binding universal stress UspA family protein